VNQIVVIGGMDPSGGAGLLRDAWTVETRAPELELHAVCTALTRQGQGRPARFASGSPAALTRALARVAALDQLRAVKLGMIPGDRIAIVDAWLADLHTRPRERRPWIVCDPVAAASAGGRLGAPAAAMLELAARVDLLTPNADELAELEAAGSVPAGVAVLRKGEPIEGRPDRIRDRLRCADGTEQVFERPRVSGPDPRGTGCALASAIAAELARGRGLISAVAAAIAWLDGARQRATRVGDAWHLGGV
jgi:hydroxymethylpyrimidine/phosphomethylpyrimidine kinase